MEAKFESIDLAGLAETSGTGPRWGTETEDFNATMLVWREGEGVAAHSNDELDVLMIGISGVGEVMVDGKSHELKAGMILVVPKGSERAIRAISPTLGYLNVHKRRKKLMPATGTKPWATRSLPGQPLDDGSATR